VVSYDTANKLLTITLSEASFLPSSQQVVVDLTNARYAHGTVADLTAGTVVSYDTANKLLTLALAEASFLPSSQQVVVDLTNARYAHGTVADLTAGTVVSFKGALNTAASPTSDVLARVVDVEGAASSSSNSGNALSEVNGTITAVSGTTVTLNTSSGVITVNTSGALVKEGKASCLAVGGTLEAKGTLSGSTLTARVLEVSGGGCVDNRRHR